MSTITRIARSALLIALSLGFGGSARALSLADLNGGASFATPDGALTFSEFHITLPAMVGSDVNAFAGVDLSLFTVDVVSPSGPGASTLEFNLPLVAAGDQVGRILMDYKVTAGPAMRITGAGLAFTGTAIGAGALARIDEVVSAPAGDVALQAIRQSGGAQQPTASTSLPSAPNEVLVTNDILLDVRSRSAAIAQLSEVEHSFTVAPIPEPGAIAIFAASLGLLTAASRRRLL
jgi:hypothetical protein